MSAQVESAGRSLRNLRFFCLNVLLLSTLGSALATFVEAASPISNATSGATLGTFPESANRQDPFACAGDLKFEQFPDGGGGIPAQDQCGQILAQAADDFPGMGDRVIGFSWCGIYQHPPESPPEPPEFFRIEIYTTNGQGQPDQLVYATQVNNYVETREPTQNDLTPASYCAHLPDDFYADEGQNFFVSITAGLCQPEQWGWLTAEGSGSDAWVRVPGEFEDWTPISDAYGIPGDLSFGVICMPTRVDITKSVPGWWPGFGNTTTYTSCIYWFDPRTNTCIFPGPAKIIQFDLSPISRELGYCLNQGVRSSLDLHLNTSANSAFAVVASVAETCDLVGFHDHWTSVETKSCVTEATVTVVSEDYGAFGFIEASAFGCLGPDPSPILPREPGGPPSCTDGPARTKIPRDDNGNDIEDTFAGDASLGNHTPTWDAETELNPLATSKGDGLTRYEEWRGVTITGAHTRLSTTLKDLFVYRENTAWGAGDAQTVATIHWITANEMNGARHDPGPGTINAARGPRIINFNRTSHSLHDQHGLWRRVAGGNGSRGNWGLTRDNTGGTDGANGPPRANGRIEVYIDNITSACATANGRVFRRRTAGRIVPAQFSSDATDKLNATVNWIIGHEMGHAINLRHHASARRWVGHGPRPAADGWFDVNTNRPISGRSMWDSVVDERDCCMAYGFFDIWNSVSLARRTRPLRWTSTSAWWGLLPSHTGYGTTCTVPGRSACRIDVKIDDAD